MGLPSKKWETINPTINGCFISCPSRLLHFSHGCNFALYWVKKISGIMPDVMHITHLALLPDVITSLLLDWSDDRKFWSATSREGRLNQMWQSYRSWCEEQGYFLRDRASRKLFTSRVLQPDTTSYVDISQKVLSATAARYMVHWISSLACQFAAWTGNNDDLKPGCI